MLEDSVPPHQTVPPDARDRIWRRVEVEFARSDQVEHRSRRRLSYLVTAAVCTAVAVVIPIVVTGGGSSEPQPAAASPLLAAAEALTQSPSGLTGSAGISELRANEYVYREQEEGDQVVSGLPGGRTVSYLAPETVQTWRRADGSGLQRTTALPAVYQTSTDRRDAPPTGQSGHVVTQLLPARSTLASPSYANLSDLPTDVGSLRGRLEAEAGTHVSSQQLFQAAADALSAGCPQRLQSALYELLATVPHVEVGGHVHDALGRAATLASTRVAGLTNEILFDPSSGAYLGQQRVDSSTGLLASYKLVRAFAVVPTLPVGAPSTVATASPGETESPPPLGG